MGILVLRSPILGRTALQRKRTGPTMKMDFEVAGLTITAMSQDKLGDGSGFGSVVDLRKAFEIKDDPAPGLKEKNVAYYRMGIDAASLSEQDMDHLRRELARRAGPYAIVSSGGKRAVAMCLMHAGRTLGWSVGDTLAKSKDVAEDKVLSAEITNYIERHVDRKARYWSKEAGST
jgi:hypothetical protein